MITEEQREIDVARERERFDELHECLTRAVELAYDQWGDEYAWDYCIGTLEHRRAEQHPRNPTPPKKRPIPKELRWEVWERDDFTCQHCGSRRDLACDHIHPESKGGEATRENLQTLCRRCNSAKGNR